MADQRTEQGSPKNPASGAVQDSTSTRSASSGSGPAGPPVPSLPKGGGAIHGIGEKFSANPVTGTAQIQIPVAISPGRAGFQPDLSLSYDSGAGNGPFGHGFHLSVPQIARKTDKGLPRYDDANDSDVFLLSGAEDLVPKRLASSGWQKERFDDGADIVERYVPRIEGLFAQIEKREQRATGVVYWQATTRDNVTSTYGRSASARIAHPAHPKHVFCWQLEETRDDRGNILTYEYKAEDLLNVPRTAPCEANRHGGDAPIVNRYLKRIRYGNTVPFDASTAVFEVVFDYGEHDDAPTVEETRTWPSRQDPFSTYRAGFEVRTYRLCRRVLMFHRMVELGDTPCLVRSTDLTYAASPVLTQLVAAGHTGYIRDPSTLGYTKKSTPTVELGYSIPQIQTEIRQLDRASVADLPQGVQGAYQWIDLDGEGLPGVLSQQGDALFYKQNLGDGDLAPARPLLRQPSLVHLGGGQQFTDLDGDGRKELTLFTPPQAGYFDRTEEGGFEPLQLFPQQLFINWADPNLRHIDLNGDGHEDVLITHDGAFTWYPSLAKGGFGPAITFSNPRDDEKGPALVFADGTQTIFLADMSGDGLTDLVRITNGSVCYWPNLGYGRFGAKVQMGGEMRFDHAEAFDPRRIRLADVDGSGTTDVLYLHGSGVRIHENQAGNSLGPAIQLPLFPDQSDLAEIATVDLLGTGTACLVWSSALPGQPFRSIDYIDLLGSKKPYLLTSYKNNLGLEIQLDYASSTRFSLGDAMAGRPWVTRLPFPVHVLVRTETYDAISRHRFVSTYAYHHGYFDGVEREFRGFGVVEQWDTESFSRFSGKGALPPPANASDPELHLPPVRIKTWFHRGAWTTGESAKQVASEYYGGDAKAARLPEAVLPSGLSSEEVREAGRALKGQILRQEIYADDGSAAAQHPYLVSQRSYAIRKLQPQAGTAPAVFFVHPREAIEYHYERNPSDPRITHALTLEVDEYGATRRSAAVGYPRRAAKIVYDEQKQVTITLTEANVVHHAPEMASGWYRVGVPIEARAYELTGLLPATDALFTFDEVLAAASGATALPYEAVADGSLQKRLLSQSRTLYERDDLAGPLPLGQVESLALPYQAYAKAFTPALLASALGGRATDPIVAEGGYVRFLPDDDAWWIPSGRQIVSKAEFCLPVSFLDPFGNPPTTLVYDAYHLAVTQATDPIGNVVAASYDYRVLAPFEVTDPNGNRGQARFDELGMAVATAVMGKTTGPIEGDTLEDPTATFSYDLDRYRLTGKPSMVHGRARETHGVASTRWQESYSYSDGSGHEVMRKIQAEPGDVPQMGDDGKLVRKPDGTPATVPADPRWVGTGRTVLDNKGHPVKQYEPFFSATAEYEDEAELIEQGVTAILRYDPVGRLVRTDLPNGTFSKVVFDPWQQTSFDPNDTVLESAWYQDRKGLNPSSDPEGRAAKLAAEHANTPGIAHLDALGRTFLTIEDNGAAGQYTTTVALDVEGNPLAITDARAVLVMQHRFGMGGRKLWQKSCDAGERWMLGDVGGALLRAWDERKFTRRAAYDEARRATHLYVQADVGAEQVVGRTVYGEALPMAVARAANLRGKAYQVYDGAGVVTSTQVDFKGNLLQRERRLAIAYQGCADWKTLDGFADAAAIASAANTLLEAEVFASTTTYDALNRPTSLLAPDLKSVIQPTYNEAGLLTRVQARIRGAAAWTTFVDDIDYDAKGQREKIVYGNGTTTTYTYDPETFRLVQLKTVRDSDGSLLQNLTYAYDPVGNITGIDDGAQKSVFHGNELVEAACRYEYDALYRLTQAKGREHAGLNSDIQQDEKGFPLVTAPNPNDPQAVRGYTERYAYDEVGNILQMVHQVLAGTGGWTRRYAYETDPTDATKRLSNRLVATSLPNDGPGQLSAHYTYDAHGNTISMPHLLSMGWNHHDQMQAVDLGGGGTAFYTYDAAGQRVRKVWEHSGLVEERIYLGGWEVYRKRDLFGKLLLERATLHGMDGARRVVMVETKTVDVDAGGAFSAVSRSRFQLDNHLGSASLEVDSGGLVIGYEEYHPYGTTAYASGRGGTEVSRKRYRYTGKERDEETGLYYHGARHYAAWLGTWSSADRGCPVSC